MVWGLGSGALRTHVFTRALRPKNRAVFRKGLWARLILKASMDGLGDRF